MVRVERRGKSSPATWEHRGAVNSIRSNTVEETQGRPGCFRGGGLSAAATRRLDRWLSRQNPAYRTDHRARQTSLLVCRVSLSKKSPIGDFFDKLASAYFARQAKYVIRKSLKSAFRTLADPIRGGPCPLELPCSSLSKAIPSFFDRLARQTSLLVCRVCF